MTPKRAAAEETQESESSKKAPRRKTTPRSNNFSEWPPILRRVRRESRESRRAWSGQDSRGREALTPRRAELIYQIFTGPFRRALTRRRGFLVPSFLRRGGCLDECIQHQVGEKYFHHPAHARIFTVLVEMREAEQADRSDFPDTTSGGPPPSRRSRRSGRGHRLVHIRSRRRATPHTIWKFFAKSTSCARSSGRARNMVPRAYEEQGDVQILLDEVEQKILAIGDDRFRARFRR